MPLYILLIIIAGIIQIGVFYALKIGALKSFLFAIPFILLHQYLFLYSYIKAPNFIIIWFLGAAVVSILSFLLGYLILKETLTVYQVIGIVCILAGMAFMKF